MTPNPNTLQNATLGSFPQWSGLQRRQAAIPVRANLAAAPDPIAPSFSRRPVTLSRVRASPTRDTPDWLQFARTVDDFLARVIGHRQWRDAPVDVRPLHRNVVAFANNLEAKCTQPPKSPCVAEHPSETAPHIASHARLRHEHFDDWMVCVGWQVMTSVHSVTISIRHCVDWAEPSRHELFARSQRRFSPPHLVSLDRPTDLEATPADQLFA